MDQIQETIRIGTFNILASENIYYSKKICDPNLQIDYEDEYYRYSMIINMLYHSGLDIVFLQEVGPAFLHLIGIGQPPLSILPIPLVGKDIENSKTPIGRYLTDIYHVVQGKYDSRGGLLNDKQSNLVILLRITQFSRPEQSQEELLPRAFDAKLMRCVTQMGNAYINLINIHLPTEESVRNNVSSYLSAMANDTKNTHIIVGGDFNIRTRHDMRRNILETRDSTQFQPKYVEGQFLNISGLQLLTHPEIIEGYTSYSGHTCSDKTAEKKENPYKFLDRIYVKGLHRTDKSIIKPFSNIAPVHELDMTQNVITQSDVIKITNLDSLSRFCPPYCEDYDTCEPNPRFLNVVKSRETKFVWPSDHALVYLELSLGAKMYYHSQSFAPRTDEQIRIDRAKALYDHRMKVQNLNQWYEDTYREIRTKYDNIRYALENNVTVPAMNMINSVRNIVYKEYSLRIKIDGLKAYLIQLQEGIAGTIGGMTLSVMSLLETELPKVNNGPTFNQLARNLEDAFSTELYNIEQQRKQSFDDEDEELQRLDEEYQHRNSALMSESRLI